MSQPRIFNDNALANNAASFPLRCSMTDGKNQLRKGLLGLRRMVRQESVNAACSRGAAIGTFSLPAPNDRPPPAASGKSEIAPAGAPNDGIRAHL